MDKLRIKLFGKLSLTYEDEPLGGCESKKVKQLLAFLLLNRDRPHSRETLASLLWGDSATTKQSKKYLRNALWRLKTALDCRDMLLTSGLLVVKSGWIELRSNDDTWIDVAVFERAYKDVMGIPDHRLTPEQVVGLEAASTVYSGPLLASWHQEWCAVERHRFQHMYVLMLEKLSGYYEASGHDEVALSFAEKILACDRAHEGAHFRIMRLLYRLGDRTSALRQYLWCVESLREELDAEPAPATVDLYDRILMTRSMPPRETEPESYRGSRQADWQPGWR